MISGTKIQPDGPRKRNGYDLSILHFIQTFMLKSYIDIDTEARFRYQLWDWAKGSLKNIFTFYTPMHLFRLRCETSEYPDIPAFSRLAGRAPQRLKL